MTFLSTAPEWLQTDTGLTEISAYLEDDWDDNSLSSRTSPNDDVFAHPDANEAGDVLIGRYRPVWTTESGSPSVTNGELVLSDGSTTGQRISTTTSVDTEVSWSIDVITSSSSSGAVQIWVVSEGGVNNIIYLQFGSSSNYELRKGVSGSYSLMISSSYTEGNTYTAKATVDSYDNYELFLDGTSQGTTTDSVDHDVNTLHIRNTSDAEQRFDNLVVK